MSPAFVANTALVRLQPRPLHAALPRSRPLYRQVRDACAPRRVTLSTGTPSADGPAAPPVPLPVSSSGPVVLAPASGPRFVATRTLTFGCVSALYALYVLLRGTFPYAAATLSLPLGALGQVASAFPLAYATSRLVTGALVDRVRAHHALCLGLLLAAAANAGMGLCTAPAALAALWAANGLVQGVGAGASAKILTAWFAPAQRGLYWALWSTSANVGAFLAPVLVAALAPRGFTPAMAVPAALAAATALTLAPIMRSSPAEAGIAAPWLSGTDGAEKNAKESMPWRQAFVEGVLKNKVIWALAVSYFFIYLARAGLKTWLHLWLMQSRGIAAGEAAYRASSMEIGGMAGTFSAGVLSDAAGGRRVLVTLIYLAGLAVSTTLLWTTPLRGPAWDTAIIAVMGFMINGPQMMVGLVGAEVSQRRVLATATGVLGWISYLGAAASGFPLSVIIGRFGWSGMFAALLTSTACALASLAPYWRLRGGAATK